MGKVIKPEVAGLFKSRANLREHAVPAPRSRYCRDMLAGPRPDRRGWPAVGAAHAPAVYFREGSYAARLAPPQMPDASFVDLPPRLYAASEPKPSGIGWQTDYPYAEINLTTRLSELTQDAREPRRESAPELLRRPAARRHALQLPVLVASDAGTIGFQRGRGRAAAAVSAEGRLLLGR